MTKVGILAVRDRVDLLLVDWVLVLVKPLATSPQLGTLVTKLASQKLRCLNNLSDVARHRRRPNTVKLLLLLLAVSSRTVGNVSTGQNSAANEQQRQSHEKSISTYSNSLKNSVRGLSLFEMSRKRAVDEEDEIYIEEEETRPLGPLATYADVPKTEMDEWTTALAGFPCDVVSDVFLGWCRESRWTGFIPAPPPPPTPEQLVGPPKVELTAKGLPSFRCARPEKPGYYLCPEHQSDGWCEAEDEDEVLDLYEVLEWAYDDGLCEAGSALDV